MTPAQKRVWYASCKPKNAHKQPDAGWSRQDGGSSCCASGLAASVRPYSNTCFHICMANQPLPDIMLESFAAHVAGGSRPGQAYRDVYAIGKDITRQACDAGGKVRMNYPLVVERIRQIKAQTGQLPPNPRQSSCKPNVKSEQVQPLAPDKIPSQLIKDDTPANPRQALLKRLWQAVSSDTNPEAIQACKALRDWIESDEKAAKSSEIADPAVICSHLHSITGDYAALDDQGKAIYCKRIVDALGKLGITWGNLLDAMSIRADAPPILETIDSIDPNEPTKSDAPPISATIQEKQCPPTPNANA